MMGDFRTTVDTKPGSLDRSAVIRLATVLIIAIAMFPIVGHSRATPAHATEDAWDAVGRQKTGRFVRGQKLGRAAD